jgi:hypothetical protein
MWFDIDHAVEALGWTPTWSTDAMFAQSYDWFVEHRGLTDDATASPHRRVARQGVLGVAKRMSRFLPRASGDTT